MPRGKTENASWNTGSFRLSDTFGIDARQASPKDICFSGPKNSRCLAQQEVFHWENKLGKETDDTTELVGGGAVLRTSAGNNESIERSR